MRNAKRLLKLAMVLLCGAAFLAPGDISWSQGEFYVVGAGSPWQRNGTNLYYNGGNVGIGTNSPIFPLHIVNPSGLGAYVFTGGAGGWGLNGENTSPGGTGVIGKNSASTGAGYGVYGITNSPTGYGVYGTHLLPGGTAIYGRSWALSGNGIGVYGGTDSSTGFGVYGVNSATSGSGVAVYGETKSPNYGQGFGVYGKSLGGPGVYGEGGSVGVYGISTTGYGSYGVYCAGDFRCTGNSSILGTKSAVVATSQGPRKLYSQESPEVWFEDFGEGQLQGGAAQVNLDPLFLETVTVNEQQPLKVFIQLNGDCHGVYVQRQAIGFKVVELAGGTSSARFTYRVVAKRKGFETARLEAAPDTPKVADLKKSSDLAALQQ